jgi:hypothetical protein
VLLLVGLLLQVVGAVALLFKARHPREHQEALGVVLALRVRVTQQEEVGQVVKEILAG